MNKTQEEFVLEIQNKFNGNISVIGTYVDKRTDIEFYCNKCHLNFTSHPQNILHSKYGCKECAKKARKLNSASHSCGRLIDNYPHLAQYWDYDKNADVDINNIACKSGKKVWWICSVCGKSYQSKVSCIVNGTQRCMCHNCYKKTLPQVKVKTYLENNGSFAEHYSELLNDWAYELNQNINPYKLTDKSNKSVWWICKSCGHKWQTKIAKRTAGEGCPYCARHTKSTLQVKIEDYIRSTYDYLLLNEHGCRLKCYNPQTGYRLLYDNELIVDNNINLIIECHGEQHYRVCGWSYTQAKAEHCTPQEVLEYQQWKDIYKKQYALDNGYSYLAIPYWTESDESYKQLIDDKIHEILTQQNN